MVVRRILVTGALGQIGSELVPALRDRYGAESVMATDVREPEGAQAAWDGPYRRLDSTVAEDVTVAVRDHDADTVYHLAALLSAVGERDPQRAWEINMGSLVVVLEAARERGCAVFVPSSIGAFGPSTPRQRTPQETIQRPTSMYGVTKVAGELLCDYYHTRFGVDARGVRYPGIISHVTPPGGGTTDYAVEIYYEAIRQGSYTCFLEPETRLDMMYMPDCVAAAIGIMEAEATNLRHRNAFNVTATNFTPEEVAAAIRTHIPGFKIDYDVDPVRQGIANSWPESIDDTAAREEWGWSPGYDLDVMTEDMLRHLRAKLTPDG
jgi:nucleoside-diphosphate-sugar epimerase